MLTLPAPLRASAAAAAGLLLSASALSSSAVDVYAGGEALPPELEARLIAQSTGALTRAEVREQLAEALATGTLAGGGEISDTDELLRARVAYNDRQTRTLLARHQAPSLLLAAAAPARDPVAAPAPQSSGGQMGAAAPVAGDVPVRDSIEPSTEQLVDEAPAPAPAGGQPSEPTERRPLSAEELPAAKPDELPLADSVDRD